MYSDTSQLLLVDPKWRHAYGPLHDLLTVQGGVCAVCGVPADWVERRDGTTRCNLDQVSEPTTGLLLALVCRACVQALDGSRTGHDSARAVAVASLLADPPARRCASTATSRPLSSGRRPSQDPWAGTERATPAWKYYSTVVHCLNLFQRGRCAICRCALTVASDPASVHLDHDPASTDQAVRGLLCRRCNNCEGQPYTDHWWGPLAEVLHAYRAAPPASRCPDTTGLRMSGRHRAATITRAANGAVLLGQQVLISAPAVLLADDADAPHGEACGGCVDCRNPPTPLAAESARPGLAIPVATL